jgi:transposase
MTTLKKRKKYTTEYKKEAVALVTEKGYAIKQAADVVDTSEKNLRRWVKDLKQEIEGVRLTADDRLELVRLKREVKELRMEKEILKKASAFFAKEMK